MLRAYLRVCTDILMHRSAADMYGEGWGMRDEDVILVENEAESVQVPEEKYAAGGQIHLDRCPICQLNFHSREPRLLPCLHSFCNKCLPSPSRKLATKESPNWGSSPRESLCLQTNRNREFILIFPLIFPFPRLLWLHTNDLCV